jgi:hypothetical protein
MWKSAVSISTVGGQRTQLSAILCDDWRQTRSDWLSGHLLDLL